MTRAPSGLPFDDIRNLLAGLPAADDHALSHARQRTASLAVPVGSLGRLADVAEWMATWQGSGKPTLTRPLIAIFAATNELAAHDPAAAPADATHRLVELYAAGGGAVNQVALQAEAGLKVFDLALDMPVPDIRSEPGLSEAACAATMAFGMEAIAGGTDLLCLGAAGAGNRLMAGALAASLFGGAVEGWVEDGPDDAVRQWRLAATQAALETHASRTDPLEALRHLGGREIAAIAGAILAARYQRIPVVLDGFVSCVAAAVLWKLAPHALDHCMVAQRSGEPAHDRLLSEMGFSPLLDTGIRLEDGCGAALAVGLIRSALAIHGGMAAQDQISSVH